MQIGLLLGGLADARALAATAAEAESLGFASLWAGDHIAFPAPILDPLQVLSCFAAATQRVQLGTCVYLVPLRHPTVIAKMVSSLDFISAGRVIFGAGVGGEFPREFEASGIDVRERGGRTNEALIVLRKLWQGGRVEHAGKFFRFAPVELKPPPVQAGGPPIWVGGRSDAALRRTAKHGDGYVGYLLSPEQVAERAAKIAVQRHTAGAADRPFTLAHMAFAMVADDRAAAVERAGAMLGAMYGRPMESAAQRYCIVGTADDCRAAAQRFADVGVEHLILTPMAYGDGTVDQIRALAKALL